jgi:hypothetical protein
MAFKACDGRRPDFKARILPVCWLALSITAVSCATAPMGKKDLLGFLQVGQTTRQDVYLHLGDPSNEYEGGRIVTFRIGEDEGGLYPMVRTPSWRYDRYSLVLALDETGVLRRYALVQVRSP